MRGVRFRIDFRTPYLRLPVAIDKSQIGRLSTDGTWQVCSFRFFDWHSWSHIDGTLQWHGEPSSSHRRMTGELATGFSYLVPEIPGEAENFGIRLACALKLSPCVSQP